MLSVNRAGVRGGQDGNRYQVVVDSLLHAIDMRVVQRPGMVQGGGEECCVAFG